MTIDDKSKRIISDQPLTFYHGSRQGISGNIQPISRPNCDFGSGFYMGTNSLQIKGPLSTQHDPKFYEIRFDPSKLNDSDKLILEGNAWLCTVIGFRSSDQRIQNLPAVRKAIEKVSHADLVIGAIADDRMSDALRRFLFNGLSDEALIQCLRSVDYGYQYVLKTEKACQYAEITECHPITGTEKDQAIMYSQRKRKEPEDIINHMAGTYNRKGHFLQEIIDHPEFLQYEGNHSL